MNRLPSFPAIYDQAWGNTYTRTIELNFNQVSLGPPLVNDTSTAGNMFPVFARTTNGNASVLYTGSPYMLYNPSTGEYTTRVPFAGNGIFFNSNTVTSSYTTQPNSNGLSAGPVTINDGQSITISDSSTWTVV